MQRTPLDNGHYFDVLVSAVKKFHYKSILINAMYFWFLLFASTRHDHELMSETLGKLSKH